MNKEILETLRAIASSYPKNTKTHKILISHIEELENPNENLFIEYHEKPKFKLLVSETHYGLEEKYNKFKDEHNVLNAEFKVKVINETEFYFMAVFYIEGEL